MKRHIPGLHGESPNAPRHLGGRFPGPRRSGLLPLASRNDRSTFCGSPFSNQENIRAVPSTVASTALPKRFGNSAGSCGTLATTPI